MKKLSIQTLANISPLTYWKLLYCELFNLSEADDIFNKLTLEQIKRQIWFKLNLNKVEDEVEKYEDTTDFDWNKYFKDEEQ